MSPLPKGWPTRQKPIERMADPAPILEETPPVTTPETYPTPSATEQRVTPPPSVLEGVPSSATPLVIQTELDAYLADRLKGQPKSLADIDATALHVEEQTTKTRMSLPDAFEAQSYDCTQGPSCRSHVWKQTLREGTAIPKWSYQRSGKYAFYWVNKVKRAVDHALDVRGWFPANRVYFPGMPGHLFSVNGTVERGSAILMFMPYQKALRLREFPGQRSRELIKARMTELPPKRPGTPPQVIMTNDPDNAQYYMPTESADARDADHAPAATL